MDKIGSGWTRLTDHGASVTPFNLCVNRLGYFDYRELRKEEEVEFLATILTVLAKQYK